MRTFVKFSKRDDVGFLTFCCDDPSKPPTLDLQVLDQLEKHLEEIERGRHEIRSLILRSESEKYFIVGANINALKDLNSETIIPWVNRGHAVLNKLESLSIPIIARTSGYVLGGGLEVALACDFIVATEKAKFGQPEARLGLVTGWGGSYRLPSRIGRARAKELSFTGMTIDARTAFEIGLVDFVGEDAAVDDYLKSLLEGVGNCTSLAVASMKNLINKSQSIAIENSCTQESLASVYCLSDSETKNRITAFLER